MQFFSKSALDEITIRSTESMNTRKDRKRQMQIKEEGYVALPLISVTEAAGYLGVSRKTIYKFVELGEVTAVRIGRSIRVEKKSLDRIKQAGGWLLI